MRFHVVSLPHSQTTREYGSCAFTEKVRKFSDMMMSLGHEVFLYAGDENDAACTELVTCITREEQRTLGIPGPERVFDASFDESAPQWVLFNARAALAIEERAQPQDFLCIIGGLSNRVLTQALPGLMCVEFGIGYPGSFAAYRVFESYAWMHATYGAQQGLGSADGRFYDAVIPSYFEEDAFPLGAGDGGFLLYVGRLTERKGLQIASDVMDRTGYPLVVAGDGDRKLVPAGAEYVGHVGPDDRATLMGQAVALLAPTLYLEPFGSVVCEAAMCGTPAITTDWGAFTETVEHGVTGFRCRTLKQFADAAKVATHLDRQGIAAQARERWGMEAVRWLYQGYFKRLLTLWEDGFYA